MKIGLLWLGYWPYSRRGTERMVRDIAEYLAGEGHRVHILTTKPGPSTVEHLGPITVYRQARISHPLVRFYTHRFGREIFWADLIGLQTLPQLLREQYDLVHAFFYTYLPGLRLMRWLRGTPVIFHSVMAPPHRKYRLDRALMMRSLTEQTPVRVFSRFGVEYMRNHYDVDAHAVAPTVDPVFFSAPGEKDLSRPRILFTADLADPTKGAAILAEAFNHVHRARPNAVLQFAGPVSFDPPVVKRLLERVDSAARDSVELIGPGALQSVPRLYAEAAVTVLPSVGEPFGMVLTESLASGTPVVGSNSGAIPEIVSDPAVGTIFDRTDDIHIGARNLANALLRSLELAADPATGDRCRQHARAWTWEALGEPFNRLQDRALHPNGPAGGLTDLTQVRARTMTGNQVAGG